MSIDDDSLDIEARLAGTDLEKAFDRFMRWAYRRDAYAIRAEIENESLLEAQVVQSKRLLELRAEVAALKVALQKVLDDSEIGVVPRSHLDLIERLLRGEGEK